MQNIFYKLLFISIWLMPSISHMEIYGQSTYFNNIIEYNDEHHFQPQVVDLDQELYFLSPAYESNPFYGSSFLTKTDSAGNIIWTNRYRDSLKLLAPQRTLNLVDSSLYFLLQSVAPGVEYSDKLTILKVNSEGETDTLALKAKNDSTLIYNAVWNENGSFVCTGSRYYNKDDSYWFISGIDTNGNTLFYKEYQWVGNNIGYTVHPTPDGGFVMGGVSVGLVLSMIDQSTIIKTDSVGNIEWRRAFGDRWVDYKAFCTVTDSNTIIASMTHNVKGDDNWPWDGLHRNYVVCLDMNGDIIWDKYIGKSHRFFYTATETVKQLSDGSILFIGSDSDFFAGELGYIHKMTPNGDSIFTRTYRYLKDTWAQHYLRDFTEMPNGDLVLTGFFDPFGVDTVINASSNRMWLLRTDSLGCLFEGCDTACTPYQIDYEITHDSGLTYTFELLPPVVNSFTRFWDADSNNIDRSYDLTFSITFPDTGLYYIDILGEDQCTQSRSRSITLDVQRKPTGISLLSTTAEVKLYPNPASQQITLQWDRYQPGATLTLQNQQGQVLQQELAQQATETIPVSQLPAGLYLAILRDREGAILHREKVMVVR